MGHHKRMSTAEELWAARGGSMRGAFDYNELHVGPKFLQRLEMGEVAIEAADDSECRYGDRGGLLASDCLRRLPSAQGRERESVKFLVSETGG